MPRGVMGMVERDALYWLDRLEDVIDELENAYEDRDWDEVYDLIDELRRILKNLRKLVVLVDYELTYLVHE
jgi:DNA modification methylase